MNEKNSEMKIVKNLSAISHEMRTPLNLIAATATLINMKMDNDVLNNDDLKEYIKNILTNCNKAAMLVENILETSLVTVSKFEYANTRQFFETFCKNVEPYCNESGTKLKTEFYVEKEYMHFPVDTTERILLNLITNAIKYNDKKTKKITVKMSEEGNNIIFSVKDNGMGIAKENIEKVAEPFFRVDSNLPNGVGLGLNLVKEYLDSINGTMKIKSQIKKGTEVIISIPVTPEDEIYTSGESDYIYHPEKTKFIMEFAQLKKTKDI